MHSVYGWMCILHLSVCSRAAVSFCLCLCLSFLSFFSLVLSMLLLREGERKFDDDVYSMASVRLERRGREKREKKAQKSAAIKRQRERDRERKKQRERERKERRHLTSSLFSFYSRLFYSLPLSASHLPRMCVCPSDSQCLL